LRTLKRNDKAITLSVSNRETPSTGGNHAEMNCEGKPWCELDSLPWKYKFKYLKPSEYCGVITIV
jgi:hypothetical protein